MICKMTHQMILLILKLILQIKHCKLLFLILSLKYKHEYRECKQKSILLTLKQPILKFNVMQFDCVEIALKVWNPLEVLNPRKVKKT